MAAMSDYLENVVLNHFLRGQSVASPVAVYAGLFNTDPTDADIGTEVAGEGYVRQKITFGVPSNGMVSNSEDIMFPVATTDWGEVGYVGVYDAVTAGNLLFHGNVDIAKTITQDDQLIIPVGKLTISID